MPIRAAFLTRVTPHIGFGVCLVFCIAILYVQLGGFGYFDPQETGRVEVVEQIEAGNRPPTFPAAVAEYGAVLLKPLLGDEEWVLRLPSTLFALAAVLVIYLVLLSFLGPVAATFGAEPRPASFA